MNLFKHLMHDSGFLSNHHNEEDTEPEQHFHHEEYYEEGSEFMDDAIRMTDQPLRDYE